MNRFVSRQKAQVIVGCMCPCRRRYYPTDPELLTLAQSRNARDWWVLVECQVCGNRLAFGEINRPHVALRFENAKYPVRPVQIRRQTYIGKSTSIEDGPLGEIIEIFQPSCTFRNFITAERQKCREIRG